ncbi:hypothetical protein ETB97_001636 [Aspergillus alliaceus]|uniref:Uncharacterized protein n=1 Tax=Petromyces alliaceus TaxID=209559 RepID=A0A5N6FZ92_PETAA|nr:uncharacterized protein BDW43DRAFT_318303 [Aspergillus alliaceus]KAB8235371.1 hypothetical protein BDW43DRAFT_318303 [Aspergillus alliaceus]KAE8384960.1 hypothetical protein BDV23DRAFT_176657 [Aspergillus alliaceus]KAF5860416.1 hypothetical protein ETB97_001636 [Aspergillus burnettii]
MRQQEMSHSPAYYQEHDQRMTAYLHDSTPTPAAAHLSPEPSLLPNRLCENGHDSRSSERNSAGGTSPNAHPSDSWDRSYSRHPFRHSHQPQKPPPRQTQVESIYSNSEGSVVAPMTFVSSPYPDNSSMLTQTSCSGGGARKEERVRGSWTDHSSYMSSDNHHLGAARLQKRAIHTEEPLADDSQDALLMLFRLSLPVPVFSFGASLYTVFGLLLVLLVSPFRICPCIPYFRSTSFREQLCHLLVPQLHIHERLVRLRGASRSSPAQSVYNDADDPSVPDLNEHYSIMGLILVLLLSSLLSIAFLLLVWTAAFFWVFAMVLGNPDGTERKDDGRAAVLGVCRWWHIWLRKVRKRSHQ